MLPFLRYVHAYAAISDDGSHVRSVAVQTPDDNRNNHHNNNVNNNANTTNGNNDDMGWLKKWSQKNTLKSGVGWRMWKSDEDWEKFKRGELVINE